MRLFQRLEYKQKSCAICTNYFIPVPKQFDDAFHFLAENPSVGKKCEHIKTGYKKFPQGSHIIFYRESTKSKIIIIRILHKNMDVESRFFDK